ncbi:MAG: POTRA domain-containing protein, partial [Calditrichia bacterium]
MRKIHFSGLFISIFCLSLFLMSSQGLGQDENSSASLVVSSINITGNTKTQKNVILSLLDFKVGDSIDKERLGKNVARLEGSNFFKSVNVYTQPGEEKGFINVYIEIRERRWPSFQFKSGFNELDGWYISPLGIRFDNFFGHG